MKKLTLLFLLVNFSFSLNAQQKIKEYVYFDTDQSKIKSRAKTVLDELSAILPALMNPTIQLTGHTDDRGDFEYNLVLSKKRVNAIRNYFLEKGINSEAITFDFYGETNPIASNDTELDRKSNRRVEILISEAANVKASDLMVETVEIVDKIDPPFEIEETIEYTKTDLSAFKKTPDEFCIHNDRDTVLQGREGTILFFKANSFDPQKVNCNCINIQLTEFYSAKDVILNNLDTESGNRLLETSGAINIEAFCENKKLDLKRGKRLDIYFPDVNTNQGFQLFTGVEEEHGLDWNRNTRRYDSAFFPGMLGGGGSGFLSLTSCKYRFFLKRWFCNWKAKKRKKKWKNQFSELLNELAAGNPNVEFANLGGSVDLAQAMVFTSSNLGYINCDRFLSTPKRQLADVYIKGEETVSMTTSIVFKDIKSVMSGQINSKGQHWYNRIPKDKEVWVVAIKKEDEQFFLALEERNTSRKEITDLQFEAVSKKDLVASLKEMKW